MSILTNPAFYLATAERAVKTTAQSAVAILTTDITGILEVDAVQALSVIGLATLVSVATSFASIPISGSGPSLTSAEQVDRVPTHRADT
ncbi:holin [Brachybacterium hainanense]|uniref:Holin n=1 Tax=Brachybacterium hainanense TaxID=1541174 RepID=A0ABV6R9A6_9MICO